MNEKEYERAAVAKGAALLDRILPGWEDVVDISKLEMGDPALCMLGQTFGMHNEKSLAKEMYPEEWKEATTFFSLGEKSYGYVLGDRIFRTFRDTNKNGVTGDDVRNLDYVCGGHDNKCEWIEEILKRREAKEGGDEV